MFNNWFYDYRKYIEHIVFEPWVQAPENFLMRPKNYGSQYLSLVSGQYLHNQFSSVAQLCQTLFNPMNRSTTGLPVHHQLPEFTQTHVHRVSDAIQPSHPLLSPSPPAPNPSQQQGLFQ